MLELQWVIDVLLEWFEQHARDLPWRRTRDPYAIWVAEVMLQQTQVKTVAPYWERWMRELPTVPVLARAAPERVLKLWEGLGYYRRARALQEAARLILARHGGRFPRRFEEVLALPGIGPYTAGAICSIAFDQPRPILDGNVTRVLTRLLGWQEDTRQRRTRERLWGVARQLVEETQRLWRQSQGASLRRARCLARQRGRCGQLNQALMELGALVCVPREPDCPACPLREQCVAHREGLVATIPNLGPRPTPSERRMVAFVLERRGSFLVRQRPGGVVNAHLWEFPNVEVPPRPGGLAAATKDWLGFAPASVLPLTQLTHRITRFRITLEVARVTLPVGRRVGPTQGVWHTLPQLQELPFTSAHRKVLCLISAQSERLVRRADSSQRQSAARFTSSDLWAKWLTGRRPLRQGVAFR
jgi:A/G-specific adenine glycosylase